MLPHTWSPFSLKIAFIPYLYPIILFLASRKAISLRTHLTLEGNGESSIASLLGDCVLTDIQRWMQVWKQLRQLGLQWPNCQNSQWCKTKWCWYPAQTAWMSQQHWVKQLCQSLVPWWWYPKIKCIESTEPSIFPRPFLETVNGD